MVMDLAQQYDQTLQETIGRSQRERNRAMRQAQEQGTSQLSNVPGSSWSDRGVEGYRGAGFQEVSAPSVDADTKSFLGNFMGDYTEGGKNQAGYYGTDNPYTQEGAYSLAQKGGFEYTPKTLQDQFQSVGQSLPSIYGKSLANQSLRDMGAQIGTQQKRTSDLFGNINWNQLYSGDSESTLTPDETWKNKKLAEWEKYANAGFLPGQEKSGWDYNYLKKSLLSPTAHGDMWKSGNTIIRYNPEEGYTKQVNRQRTGPLAGIFKILDPFLDKIDPLHNPIQKATTGESTTEGQSPYFQKIAPMIIDAFLPGVGSIVSGINAGATGDGKGVLGAVAGGTLGAGLNGVDITGMGNLANAAATGAIKGGVSSAISGDNILKGALSGGLGGGVTSGLGSMFNNSNFSSPAGRAVGDFISGAGGNLASNLFNKNSQQGVLESALASGLGRSLGGLYNNTQNIKDPKERTSNLGTANTLAKLIQQRVK